MRKFKNNFFIFAVIFNACVIEIPPEPERDYYYVNMLMSETAFKMITELKTNNALTAGEAYRIVSKYPYVYEDGSTALSGAFVLETKEWTDISDEILSLGIDYEVVEYFYNDISWYDNSTKQWEGGLVCYWYTAVSDLNRIIFVDCYRDGNFFH